MTDRETPAHQFAKIILGRHLDEPPESTAIAGGSWWREFLAALAGRAGNVGDSASSTAIGLQHFEQPVDADRSNYTDRVDPGDTIDDPAVLVIAAAELIEAEQGLRRTLRRQPSLDELAGHLGITTVRVREIQPYARFLQVATAARAGSEVRPSPLAEQALSQIEGIIERHAVDPHISLLVETAPQGKSGPVGQELADLVSRASGGDEQAWRQIVHRYARLVWAVARVHGLDRADAIDVSGITWLTLFGHLHALPVASELPRWLAANARRESLRLRAARRRASSEADLTSVADAATLAPPGEEGSATWQAFAKLPDRCQQLLWLEATMPELSYAEISAALGIPVGAIGSTYGRCLERLRRSLESFDTTGDTSAERYRGTL